MRFSTAPVFPGPFLLLGSAGCQPALFGSLEHGPAACAPQRVFNPLPRQPTPPGSVSAVKLRWAHILESLCSLFLGAQAAEHRRQAPAVPRRGARTIYKSSAICTALSAAPFNN